MSLPENAVSVAELQGRIQALAASYPAWGVRKIWAMLRREGLRVGTGR